MIAVSKPLSPILESDLETVDLEEGSGSPRRREKDGSEDESHSSRGCLYLCSMCSCLFFFGCMIVAVYFAFEGK
jgi:hypothetical protein